MDICHLRACFKDDFFLTQTSSEFTRCSKKGKNNVPFCLKYPIHFFLTVRGMLHQTRYGLPSAYIDCTFILTCSRNVSFSVAVFILKWQLSPLCEEKVCFVENGNIWKACFPLMQSPAHLTPECNVSTLSPSKGFKRLFPFTSLFF